MEGKEKDETTIGATPEVDSGSGQSASIPGDGEGIRRDLESRHINMIAIAGMIVSLSSMAYSLKWSVV